MTRPHIIANLAASADGKIADAYSSGGRFTSVYDRTHMDLLRHDRDAIVVGAKTLRLANPSFALKDAKAVAMRRALGQQRQPRAVVITASGRLEKSLRLFGEIDDNTRIDGAAIALQQSLVAAHPPLILTLQDHQESLQSHLGQRAQVLSTAATTMQMTKAVQVLQQHGLDRLLLEGGGALLWAFAAADLLDELHVTLAPCLIGGSAAPTLLAGAGWPLAQRRRLRLQSCRVVGEEIYAHYRLIRNGSADPATSNI